ncbi:hypothetical protein MMC30_009202 [Trapelia coarctata]|nr:hypothetical protein [Trapelia coarctata]
MLLGDTGVVWSLAVISAASFFLYVIGVLIYRLYFHPLAKYPGPLLARITDWHPFYHSALGDRHLEFYRTHQKYGKFVRFGPNRMSINSNTALKDIYGYKANIGKSHIYQVSSDFLHETNTVTARDKNVHARKRRVLSQALSDSAMRSMEDHILEIVRKLCECLINGNANGGESKPQLKATDGWGPPMNFADWSNYFSFDIMGTLCFGKSFNMLEKEDNRYILDLIMDGTQGIATMAHMPGLLKIHLTDIIPNKLDTGMKKFKAYSKAQSDERIRNDANIKIRDFYSYLLKARDPETGKGFSEAELLSEASALIVAGSDTSSTVLTATLFYLLHNPRTLTTLTTEIRSTFPTLEAIRSGPTLHSCAYLRACLDEAMRFSPPIGGIMPREVLAGGAVIDGEFFPEGVDVGVPHYALHHHETYYPDSFIYRPERWIVGGEKGLTEKVVVGKEVAEREGNEGYGTEETVKLAQSAFCAFSIGPRGCVGKGMAYMEMSIILARVLWLYDVRLQAGSVLGEGNESFAEGRRRRGEFQLIDTFVSKADGPMVEFKLRAE